MITFSTVASFLLLLLSTAPLVPILAHGEDTKIHRIGGSATAATASQTDTTTATIRRRLSDTPIDLKSLAGPAFPDYANGECSNSIGGDEAMTVNYGYYQSWATYRDADCHPVAPSDIDPFGYTHLAYSFAGINEQFELEPYNGSFQEEERLYRQFMSLKEQNPALILIISVGGWLFNDPGPTATRFSDMCDTPENRAVFVASTVAFCRKYGFDGIDLDWEFPGDYGRGGKPEDKQNYLDLVLELRTAFDEAPEHLEISMAIPIGMQHLVPGYDLAALAAGLDFMNIMTYNIHGSWNSEVDAHTNLVDIFERIQHFMSEGVPPNKMVLGLAPYAHTYTMADPTCLTMGCPILRQGHGGCQEVRGFMPYYTIDDYVQSGNYDSLMTYNPSTASAELVVDGDILITYDSPQSFDVKVLFAQQACLKGIMWWAVDMLRDPIPLQIDIGPTSPTPVNPLPVSTPSVSPVVTPTNGPLAGTPALPPTEPPVVPPTNPPVVSPTNPSTGTPLLVPVLTSPPTEPPTQPLTGTPTEPPTQPPTQPPTEPPTQPPTESPTKVPTDTPTDAPSFSPTGVAESSEPTTDPADQFTSLAPDQMPSPSGPSPVSEATAPVSAAHQRSGTIAVLGLSLILPLLLLM
jgi:chitinase